MRENYEKRLVAVAVVMVMVCMMLTGCGKKAAPADQTIGALFELYIKDNATPMKDLLGFETEEAVVEAFFENSEDADLASAVQEVLESSGIQMTEEESQELVDSMQTMMNKTSCTVEITSQEKDVTVVTLQVKGYSADAMMDVIMECAEKMEESMTEEDIEAINMGDEELYNSFLKQYVNDFITGIAEMEPEEEPVTIEVECEMQIIDVNGEEQIEWLPVDMDQFTDDVDAAIVQE